MVIGRTDEQQHSEVPLGRKCRGFVWRLFAEPIWASGHVPQHIGRTHDRNRTDDQTPNQKPACIQRAVHTWGDRHGPPNFFVCFRGLISLP